MAGKAIGKPADLTSDLIAELCERIMNGRSLRDVCRDDDMPEITKFYRRLHADPELAQQYARATSVRADMMFDEMFEIADNTEIGEKRKIDADGAVEITEGDMIEHRRLKIDTRKWALARMNPRKYGDKTLIGSDPENPLPGVTIFALPDNERT